MKVTIDSLVGSAGRIQSQRNTQEKTKENSVKADRAQISSRIDARIDTLYGDLREAQTDLSRNQLIKDGLGRVAEDLAQGKNPAATVNAVAFEGKKVLLDYLGGEDDYSAAFLEEKNTSIDELIRGNITALTRLQVEAENLSASNLVREKDLSRIVQDADTAKLSQVYANSSLNADAVMRLIR
ncbi:MAG: hypothetical protein ACRCUT_04315 [Spirochaetota bacterium]